MKYSSRIIEVEDITILELKVTECKNPCYEYYVRDNRHAFEFSFGVEINNRFSKSDLAELYHNGYFSNELERV